MRSRVAVIVPTRNRAHCLHIALASLGGQTYKNLEVIVVDDASTDNTREICIRFKKIYGDKIKYIANNNQMGVSSSRNRGVKNSDSEFITFLDSDDAYYPQKIENQLNAMKSANAKFSTCFYATTTDINDVSDRNLIWWPYWKRLYPDFLLPENPWIVTPGVMLTRDVYENNQGFENSMETCEDLDLWSRILMNVNGLVIPEVLVCICQPKNRIKKYNKDLLARDVLYKRVFERDKKLGNRYKKRLYVNLFQLYYNIAKVNDENESVLSNLIALNELSARSLDEIMTELPLLVNP